jgi:iron complex transport system ATP-binding protein
MSDGLVLDRLTVRRGTCPVVDAVSLAAPCGAVTVLAGPNGAGKSTLIKAVLGLLPSAGGIRFAGTDLRAVDAAARARLVAYVPQRSQLAAALPVAAVVATGTHAHAGWLGRSDARAVVAALAAVDATHLAARPFNAISAGEQQRVLVARALATGAPCVLMDEPTAALDVGHALALLALVRRLAGEGRSVVLVLHHLDDARRTADRLVLMHRGRLTAEGPPEAVLASPALAAAFGVLPEPGGAMGFRLAGGAP